MIRCVARNRAVPFGPAGIRIIVAFLTCFFCSAALGQGIDGHGPMPPANTEDAAAPMRSWAPVVQDKALRGSLLFEFALGSVVQQTYSPTDSGSDATYKKVWLDNLFGANLNINWGPHERVGLSATAPVWFYLDSADGPAAMTMGDVEFAVPVGLLLPRKNRHGGPGVNHDIRGRRPTEPGGPGVNHDGVNHEFGLSAVPFVRLPTGSSTRWVGDGGVGGGLLLAAGLNYGVFASTANVGIDIRQRQAFDGPGDVMMGGPALR
ncbi:MAG: hypothetical protein HN348_33230, partial [Proteobacteria bacterium]|nr:hypothetical protein [Pseudomonadota bacterium]